MPKAHIPTFYNDMEHYLHRNHSLSHTNTHIGTFMYLCMYSQTLILNLLYFLILFFSSHNPLSISYANFTYYTTTLLQHCNTFCLPQNIHLPCKGKYHCTGDLMLF